jgi:hypothetical protein
MAHPHFAGDVDPLIVVYPSGVSKDRSDLTLRSARRSAARNSARLSGRSRMSSAVSQQCVGIASSAAGNIAK